MFWRRRDQEQDQQEPADTEVALTIPEAAMPHGDLVPIRIYTEAEVVDGWTRLGSQRLSDLLNAEDTLSVSRVDYQPSEDDWRAFDRERMMLVVAPPHSSPRQLRVHRQKREIRARSAHYAVRGTVHLIPGNRLDRTVVRTRQHFLPITDALLSTPVEPNSEEEVDVVLVNVVDAGEEFTLEVVE